MSLALYARLRDAYDRGDRATLTQLWREAKPVELGTGE